MRKIFNLFLLLLSVPAAAQSLPPGLLGGMIKSDSWTIRKDLRQEEFKGNVSYSSPAYKLSSDYALSDRAANTFTLDGNVRLLNKEADGAVIELSAAKAVFNTAAQKGFAVAFPSKPLQLIYSAPGHYKITSEAKTMSVDGKKNIIDLKDRVKIKYETPSDFALAFADAARVNRADKTALLTGNAKLDNKDYSVYAGNIFYNGKKNLIEAGGNYPLVTAENADASAAVQADYITVNAETKKVYARGRISGWLAPKEN